ncbi:MAG: sulfatase-like hydrolase/transferase [Caulobacteraceae bacterium]
MAAPLNVLFITADQWRGDCLSARGHPMVKTPNLDALAAQGVLFERHYANAAPCGPSRASLHTGLYLQNHRSGTNGTPLDARHTNWALEAAKLGYDPVLFGYTDTSRDPRGGEGSDDSPWLRTYEGPLPGIRPIVHLDGDPTPWTDWLKAKGYETPPDARDAYGWRALGPEYEDGAPQPRALAFPAEVDDVAFLTGRLIDYLKGATKPFVAHLSLLRPHPPFVAPTPYNAMYDPAQVPGFRRAASADEEGRQHPWLAWRLSHRQHRATDIEPRLRRLKAVYFGLISRVDAEIGRLMAFLDESGLARNTLVIFTSDHGEELGDHWLMGKGGYFDGSYYIPLIVRDPRPGAARGVRIGRFTENVDIVPTLLEAIGAPVSGPVRRPQPRAFPVGRGAGRLARGGALGVRLPQPARRQRRTPAGPHPAPVRTERGAGRALQVRAFHQAAAAVLRPGGRSGRGAQPGGRSGPRAAGPGLCSEAAVLAHEPRRADADAPKPDRLRARLPAPRCAIS